MWDFVMWIVIGIVAGWLAGLITKDDHSIWGDLVLGLLGAFVAGLVVDSIGPESNSILFSIIAATIGAVVLVIIKNLIMGRRAV